MSRAAAAKRPLALVERAILLIRGQRVMLDSDLAGLYGVETRALIQAVKRNAERFPGDFMFRISRAESRRLLTSQSVISSAHGGRRTRPYAFTEQGVAMLSSVLRSRRAVHTNIAIVRTFVRLREMLVQHADLARRIDELEARYEGKFAEVFEAIRSLVEPPDRPEPPQRRIGFHRDDDPAHARSLASLSARGHGMRPSPVRPRVKRGGESPRAGDRRRKAAAR